MNDESSQIKSILSTLQKIMPTIIDGETKRETESETRVFHAVDPNSKEQVGKTGTGTTAVTGTDTNNQEAIVVDGHSFLNTPLADNEIRKEEYTIVMNADGKNEITDSKTEKMIL